MPPLHTTEDNSLQPDRRIVSVFWVFLGLWGLGLPALLFYTMAQRIDDLHTDLREQLVPTARTVAAETATRVATDTATRIAQQIRADATQELTEQARGEITSAVQEYQQELRLPSAGLFTPRSRRRAGDELPQFDHATAPEIVAGMPQDASIPPNGLAHLRLEVASHTTYQIDAIGHPRDSNTGSIFDPYLYLYMAATGDSLNLVATDDDGGNADTIWAARLLESLEPGTYYIVVEGFAGDGGNCTVSVEVL